MDDMFYLNTSFNQNISSWNVSNVSSCTRFGATNNSIILHSLIVIQISYLILYHID